MDKICGVYKIENLITHKIYIGISVDIKRRFGEHISKLKNGTHNNKHLLNSWNKYGVDNFSFSIVEECSYQTAKEKETYYIKMFDSFDNGYNFTLGGEGTKGIIRSKETREIMSKNTQGENNPMYGKKHSIETKLKIRENRNKGKAKKITDDNIREIKKLKGKMKQKEIAALFEVSRTTIYAIHNEKFYEYIN